MEDVRPFPKYIKVSVMIGRVLVRRLEVKVSRRWIETVCLGGTYILRLSGQTTHLYLAVDIVVGQSHVAYADIFAKVHWSDQIPSLRLRFLCKKWYISAGHRQEIYL